jgi:hypothetical protein
MEAAYRPTLLGQAVSESCQPQATSERPGSICATWPSPSADTRNTQNLDREVPPSLELMAAQIGGYSRLSTDQSSSRRVIRFQAGLLRYRQL